MKAPERRPKVRLWEYVWYAIVLGFFLLLGVFMLIVSALTGSLGNMGRLRSYLVTVGVLLLLIAGWALYNYYDTTDLGYGISEIVIRKGDNFEDVVDRITKKGIIESETVLYWAGRLRGIDTKLTPGKYAFIGRNSPHTVLDKLQQAEFVRIKVTVPEGEPIWRVAAIVAERMELDSAVFAGLNQDSAFLYELDLPYLEGHLFPETYFFPWGVDERQVAAEMVRMFRYQTEGVWPDPERHPCNLNRRQIVKLASVIEAETRVDSERVIVASVYCNRLRRNMRLDADPTVIYGLGGLDRPLYRRDLRRDTPFNTYMHKGLPPTPINSPGLAAIKAAANPAETEYLFFVADNRGGHRFSRTNAEHNRAKYEIRSARERSEDSP
jgi:UPF0755 protein